MRDRFEHRADAVFSEGKKQRAVVVLLSVRLCGQQVAEMGAV